jgi:hypothetical protein
LKVSGPVFLNRQPIRFGDGIGFAMPTDHGLILGRRRIYELVLHVYNRCQIPVQGLPGLSSQDKPCLYRRSEAFFPSNSFSILNSLNDF